MWIKSLDIGWRLRGKLTDVDHRNASFSQLSTVMAITDESPCEKKMIF